MPAAEAMQPGGVGEARQGSEVEAPGTKEEDPPPVHHKAWEAERLRALNGALGEELQPEELLLEAVEAPWKEMSFGESSDEEVEVPGWLIVPSWAGTKEDEGRDQRTGRSKQAAAEGREQEAGRSWREEDRR